MKQLIKLTLLSNEPIIINSADILLIEAIKNERGSLLTLKGDFILFKKYVGVKETIEEINAIL